MSDDSPQRRRIEGVSALSRMRSTPVVSAAPTPPTPTASEPESTPVNSEGPVAPVTPTPEPQGTRARLSGYTTTDFASLAKSTYKATAHLEDEASFSDFLQIAVDREIKRRQDLYNNGLPFAASTARLSAGRPLRS